MPGGGPGGGMGGMGDMDFLVAMPDEGDGLWHGRGQPRPCLCRPGVQYGYI